MLVTFLKRHKEAKIPLFEGGLFPGHSFNSLGLIYVHILYGNDRHPFSMGGKQVACHLGLLCDVKQFNVRIPLNKIKTNWHNQKEFSSLTAM